MKELSIEDKARRYDEAIEKLRSLHDDYDTVSTLIDIKEELENIFPELKESEDDRMKKLCISVVKQFAAVCRKEDKYLTEVEKCITWLEKQGKNNMGISEATKQKLEDNLNKALEQETPYSWNDFLKGEQKSTWSKEDEEMLEYTINCLKKPFPMALDDEQPFKDSITWLKSLKDRVQLQREWNKEDKEQLDRALYMMEQLDMTKSWDDVYNWLKSLRPQKQNITNKDFKDIINEIKTRIAQCNGFNRKHREEVFNLLDSLKPQNTWKPSDAQIIELRRVISGCSYDIEPLVEIEEHLKKLREE